MPMQELTYVNGSMLFSPLAGQGSNSSPGSLLVNIANTLFEASLAKSTRSTYQRMITNFEQLVWKYWIVNQKLIDSLPYVIANHCERAMLKAMLLLAFAAFLHIGEIAIKSSNHKSRVIQVEDVKFHFAQSDLNHYQCQS